MANAIKNRLADQLGELTQPPRPSFAWRVQTKTPEQAADAIAGWFAQVGSAGLKLPDGWFGRPHDNQFRLARATVTDRIAVVVVLDKGAELTMLWPLTVENTPRILRLTGPSRIEWRWIGYGSDDSCAEAFPGGIVEFVAS